MTWSFHSARQCFEQHADCWDSLNNALHGSHPLLSANFVHPLVTHFASDNEVLAVHQRDDNVDAMLLLTPGRFKWTTFLPSQAQIAPALIAEPESISSLLGALPLTVLALDLLCQDPDYSAVGGVPDSPTHERVPHATTLNISLSTTFEQYWQGRSRKLRQNLRRAQRATEAAGMRSTLRVVDSPEDVAIALRDYAEMECRGWKAEGGTAIDLKTVQGRFYSDMLTRFAKCNRAAIYELLLGDRLAASQIVLTSQSMLITLKTTHNEDFAVYSPGNLLDYLLLEREFRTRCVSHVEYYTNASTELLRWGSANRTISHHRWYRQRWVRPTVRLIANGAAWVRTRVASHGR